MGSRQDPLTDNKIVYRAGGPVLEISDLIVRHDPATGSALPVRRDEVIATLRAAGDRRGARIAASLPHPDGILDAVDRLLAGRRGPRRGTMDPPPVVRRAGLTGQTFPGKADLFRHALDVATVGDEQPVAVADRPEIRDAVDDTDPVAAIGRAIDYTVALFERAGDLIMVTVEAADADPDMRAAADAGSRATRQLWLTLTQALLDRGALRPGLNARTAADILYALASPHTHQLLRRHCRWSRHRYGTWLATTATQQLLGRG